MSLGAGYTTLANSLLSAFGSVGTITLKGGEGGPYTVRVAPGRRHNSRMTGGLDQTEKVIIIDKSEWDSKIARAPDIGDRVEAWGIKYAIISPDTKGAADAAVIYKCGIKG